MKFWLDFLQKKNAQLFCKKCSQDYRLWLGRDLPALFHYDQTYGPLRFLTRYRFRVAHTVAREKAYCLALLYLKASQYTRQDLQPFSNDFGAASRSGLKEFASVEEIAALPFDNLLKFINAQGKRRFADPAENAHKLHQVSRHSYPLPPARPPSINLILGLSLHHQRFPVRL